MKTLSTLFIIIAGILWGFMGVFSGELGKAGYTSAEGTAIRLIVCAVIFAIINFKKLKIKFKDIWLFIMIGIFSILTMSFTYFESIRRSSLTLASILLYTAPVMVTLMSALFYKEKITSKKIICLIGAVSGIVMISGIDSKVTLTTPGLIYGLLSAFSYALYSIIGKRLLSEYEPITVSSYAFIFAALGSVFIVDLPTMADTFINSSNKFYTVIIMLGCGIVTAAVPYTLYTLGLRHIEPGRASILACVEPLTASIIGIMFYGDNVGFVSLIGIMLIVISVITLSINTQKL